MVGEVNQKQEEYLDDIISSGNHLLSLINDMLDLSKIEAGQVKLDVAVLAARGARAMFRWSRARGADRRRAQLEADPHVEVVEADERRIRQVGQPALERGQVHT